MRLQLARRSHDGLIRRHGQQAQRAADHCREHRRGHLAALVLSRARLVDDHDGREPRIRRRRDAAEHRHVAVGRIAAARLGLPGGAGLAGDAIAGNRRALPVRPRPSPRSRAGAISVATVRSARSRCSPATASSTRRNEIGPLHAERADRRVGVRQLQRRDRQPVAARHRGDADRAPVRVVAEQARGLARDSRSSSPGRSRGWLSVFHICSGSSDSASLRHADVRALREDGREVDAAEAAVLVLDDSVADLDEAGLVSMMLCASYLPDSSPAATTNGLMLEPGSKMSVTARLR